MKKIEITVEVYNEWCPVTAKSGKVHLGRPTKLNNRAMWRTWCGAYSTTLSPQGGDITCFSCKNANVKEVVDGFPRGFYDER